MAETHLKAFVVQGCDYGTVVFDTRHVSARRRGACEMGCEFSEVESCRRAPHFDGYGPGPVPVSALLAAGWRYECSNCCCSVYQGAFYDSEPMAPVLDGDQVFCSKACHEGQRKLFEDQERLERDAGDEARRRWPGITVHRVFLRSQTEAQVIFTFPGGRYSCEWVTGRQHVSLSRHDEPAWNAFTSNHPEACRG